MEAAGSVAPFPASRMKPRAALVLTGGGARGAYHAGVLKAVREILGRPTKNPFPIVCGTSAGALNAAFLATGADDFSGAVANLLELWQRMRCRLVYRTDPWRIAKSGARWLAALMLLSRRNPVSLLDNAPLRALLEKHIDFGKIQNHVDSAALYAVCVTASGYTSGQSVSFFQGGSGLEGWERGPRVGAAVSLRVEHLLASAALPLIFPAVKVHREYFGEGSMRQIAPVNPALHLGADRVLVVGTGRHSEDPARTRSNVYPSLAQIAGHVLDSVFLDPLTADLERLERMDGTPRVLFMAPSQPLERLAARSIHELPRSVRFLLRPTGAMNRSGSNLASYLLFERSFCRALIDLGYQDTMGREAEVRDFFDHSQGRAHG